MKKCNQCKQEKDILNFGINKATKDGYKNKCKDCERNNRNIKKGYKSRKNVASLIEANQWLKENHSNYKILKWDKISLFKDLERDVEFEYSFARFKDKIQQHPERIFGATKEELQSKIKESFKEKYGVEHALQVPEIKRKVETTMLERYGTKNIMKNEEFVRSITKKIEKGKTKSEWAKELGISYSHFVNVYNNQGFDVAKNLKQKKTNLEIEIENILKKNNIEYLYDTWDAEMKKRPDFLIPEYKLIIEANGLRWHSDLFIKDKFFHFNRRKLFESFGYKALFFYTDELLNKKEIVESIILNKLKKSKRIYARKCKTGNVDKNQAKQFFEENHLMGNGSGRTYGLYCENKLVCCMQVRWKDKDIKKLEISRFCSLLNHSIVGGWSKLISHIKQEESPNQVMTFVDKRYGTGEYLDNFGWRKEAENISFAWTNGIETFHRMNFRGNSGYENEMVKIWDCGQAKHVLSY